MTSEQPGTPWRETTPPAVQGDLDALVELAVRTATDGLAGHQGFAPFAVQLGRDRRPSVTWVDPEVSGPRPRAADLLARLVDTLRERRAGLLAGGVVLDTSVAEGDAIRVEVEHRGGPALVVVVPYRASPAAGRPTLGDRRAALGPHRVWDAPVG